MNCPATGAGNITVKVYGDATCKVPFTGLGDNVASAGACLPIPAATGAGCESRRGSITSLIFF